MSLTMKLVILGAVLVGDLFAGAIVVRRMIAQGNFPQAMILAGGLAMGWIVLAVVLLTVI